MLVTACVRTGTQAHSTALRTFLRAAIERRDHQLVLRRKIGKPAGPLARQGEAIESVQAAGGGVWWGCAPELQLAHAVAPRPPGEHVLMEEELPVVFSRGRGEAKTVQVISRQRTVAGTWWDQVRAHQRSAQ